MSEIRGPLSAFGAAIVYPIEQHQRLTPPQKALANVSLAAHLVGWCAYVAPVFWRGQFLGALMRLYLHRPDDVWISVAAWAGVSVIAVLWLLAAMKAAQAPRSEGAALWRLLLGGACVWLLWKQVYPDVGPMWGPLVVFLLKGFYIAWGVSHAARFLVAAQLIGGRSAFDMVTENIAAGDFDWNAAPRRRPFWQFWRR